MKNSRISTGVVLFLICTSMVNYCCAVDPNCSECYDCDPCKTPRYIRVTLSDIVPFNGHCDTISCGECTISSMPVNGTYILEQDENNPCNWCYENNDINIVSVRAGGALFDPDPAIALGLKICAIKGYYPQFPDRTYIFASSYLVPEDGLADYFTAVKEPENGCVGDSNIPNDLTSCCCSPWMDIPPWTAGLGGTATIKELVDYNGDPLCFINFEAFAGFADDWLKTGPDLDADWDGDSDVDFEDLRRFVDKWLR